MKKLSWCIISFAVILTYTLNSGHCWAAENEPIREPVYGSPRVYTVSNSKVVFKEFLDGLTVTRIEFFDPNSGELLYGVSLQDGRLVNRREGSAVGENDGPFDESGKFVEHKYLTQSGKTVLVTKEYNGELVVYMALGGGKNNPLTVSIIMDKGKIISAHRKFRLNNEIVDFKRDARSGTYEELYINNDGSDTSREFKSGFLERERHTIPGEVRSYIVPHIDYYLRGKHAFTIKNKFNKENFREETAIYDADNKLVATANRVFGESLYLKEEIINGRKALQVIYKGQDGKKKVEAEKFEE